MNDRVRGLLASPLRNLAVAVGFVALVMAASTVGYMAAGWGFGDAAYMVILTIFSVGYEEVHPVNTAALHAVTVATIALGCTGMIVLTGALVQVFTIGQITELLGLTRVNSEIEKLKGHVIICGFGRIGVMLAKDLKDGGTDLLVLDRSEARVAEAQAMGFLALQVDAADEAGLKAGGVERARVLATVLPDDAANVFITLSARSLNPKLTIIARGEQPSTESKLIYAGADKVVLPTHIGAERIAEMILHPETARFVRESEQMRDFDKTLRDLGLHLDMITVPQDAAAVGHTVAEVEERGKGAFFVVQIDRRSGEALTRPAADVRFEPGDGVLVVARAKLTTLTAVFQAPAERVRAGRSRF
ncbi:TrkA family potassium uptake protein [Phenylobacterium sp.]|uniref:potassium channel family protein n=1 Tax=Phenylobacterium sp. TaxID=1871053 RepID=UPI0035AF1891